VCLPTHESTQGCAVPPGASGLRRAPGVGGIAGEVPDKPPGTEPFLVGSEGRGADPDVGRSRVEVLPDPGRDGFLIPDKGQVGDVADALALG
jgi:hypothetical protein